MSSGGFESIFDHAAGIVRIKCQGLPGVDAVLAALRARAGSAKADPRVNRELFFEPWIDAQQLGVPQETAEEVARQLHALSVLRLWTRVKCPEVPPEEDGTIFETDSEQEFRARVEQACPHCGTAHDLVPSQIETVYAPNFPGAGGVTPFDYDRLKPRRKVRKRPATPGTPHLQRCEEIAEATAAPDEPVAAVVALALGHNTPPAEVPAPAEAWQHLWQGPLAIIVCYLVLIIPIKYLAGVEIAFLASGVVVVLFYLTARTHTQAKLAPSALQRQVTWGGFSLAVVLFTAGTTGVEFSLKDDNRLTVPIWRGESITLPVKVEYGTVNPWLLGLGAFCFVATLIFVLVYDGRLGWFGGKG